MVQLHHGFFVCGKRNRISINARTAIKRRYGRRSCFQHQCSTKRYRCQYSALWRGRVTPSADGYTSSTASGPPFRSPRNGPPFVGCADIFPRYRGKSTSRGRLCGRIWNPPLRGCNGMEMVGMGIAHPRTSDVRLYRNLSELRGGINGASPDTAELCLWKRPPTVETVGGRWVSLYCQWLGISPEQRRSC